MSGVRHVGKGRGRIRQDAPSAGAEGREKHPASESSHFLCSPHCYEGFLHCNTSESRSFEKIITAACADGMDGKVFSRVIRVIRGSFIGCGSAALCLMRLFCGKSMEVPFREQFAFKRLNCFHQSKSNQIKALFPTNVRTTPLSPHSEATAESLHHSTTPPLHHPAASAPHSAFIIYHL